ncbi:Polygalacturonase [Sesamum alatum]|uniref:endo-polygalacturonase n=1 Tax=Sesamum alatum TaxID=300844 RepID=A0AAE1YKY3_9LAMI|nr:Polygalacturonase [Sesamum alatum]
MGLEKHVSMFLIVILSLNSICTINSLDDDHDLVENHYSQQEYGYGFEAHPSYFRPAEGIIDFDNSVMKTMMFRRLAGSVKTINVLSFGAKADGSTDDTKAFENAWKEACSSSDNVTFMVPNSRSYLLKPLRFSGPCNSNMIKMEIAGTLIASDDRSDYKKDTRHWLRFDSVENLVVEGGGTIDGNGNVWWRNSCKINKNKAITFYKCTELVVKNLKIQNAQQIHVSFERCKGVKASKLVVNAPQTSPNTDGIHVTSTEDIHLSTCTIATGDDCISIVSGSKKVRASDITCGPGHGISIGSLGSGNSEAHVSDVVVNKAKLSGTTNGVRIKTWQGGSGSANNIEFKNIEMENVKNPIIIDQSYCDQDQPCQDQSSAVQVKNVVYKNIKGTSASNVAINFDCSKSYPCRGIVLENVNLEGADGGKSEAVCKNVDVKDMGDVSPLCP